MSTLPYQIDVSGGEADGRKAIAVGIAAAMDTAGFENVKLADGSEIPEVELLANMFDLVQATTPNLFTTAVVIAQVDDDDDSTGVFAPTGDEPIVALDEEDDAD